MSRKIELPVEDIREAHSKGATLKVLAERHNCSITKIFNTVHGIESHAKKPATSCPSPRSKRKYWAHNL